MRLRQSYALACLAAAALIGAGDSAAQTPPPKPAPAAAPKAAPTPQPTPSSAVDSAALKACRAAAQAADIDPTDFKCDWAAVMRTAQPASWTGRFDIQQRGLDGGMAILDSAQGPILLAISTVARPAGHTCSVQVEAKRDGNALVATSPEDPSCRIRIVRSGAGSAAGSGLVRVSAKDCRLFCGMRGAFEGNYKPRSR